MKEDSGALRDATKIYDYMWGVPAGVTCDEAELALELPHQTASARFCDMTRSGWIYLTTEQRKTRSNRLAGVYRAHPPNGRGPLLPAGRGGVSWQVAAQRGAEALAGAVVTYARDGNASRLIDTVIKVRDSLNNKRKVG